MRCSEIHRQLQEIVQFLVGLSQVICKVVYRGEICGEKRRRTLASVCNKCV